MAGVFGHDSVLPQSIYSKTGTHGRTRGHLSPVHCVLFDRSGNYIFTGADDGLVKIWRVFDMWLLATLRGHSAEITDMSISYENTHLASGSRDKVVRVWCLQSIAPTAVLQAHSSMVTSVQFCPKPHGEIRYLVSTGNDGCICFWLFNIHTREFYMKPVKFNERSNAGAQMLCSSFSPGGALLATGNSDHVVRVYFLHALGIDKICELESHQDKVGSICYSNCLNRFVSGSYDGTARIWHYDRQEWRATILNMKAKSKSSTNQLDTSHTDATEQVRVTMVSWSTDDSMVITAISDHSIKVWNALTGTLMWNLEGHKDDVFVLEACPTNAHILLSAGRDGKMIFWDVYTGTKINKIQAFSLAPQQVFFHSDYRPLMRYANSNVLHEQTQRPPHLMPPAISVDIDGNPYPASMQRLVPVQENCNDSSFVPQMIANAHDQIGMCRSGENEDVCQSLGRDSVQSTRKEGDAMGRQVTMRPLDPEILSASKKRRQAFAEEEIETFMKQQKKKLLSPQERKRPRHKPPDPGAKPVKEVDEKTRPPEWITTEVPPKDPFVPQMGDEVIYFHQGHEQYLQAVKQENIYPVDLHKNQPWHEIPNLKAHELVKIVDIKWFIKPTRLCLLNLAFVDNSSGKLTGKRFTIEYHDLPGVADFLVLEQHFRQSVERGWKPGVRFRSLVQNRWWLGVIKSHEPLSLAFPDSLYQCFNVRWDDGSFEKLSPWDMEPINPKRKPRAIGGGFGVLPDEYKALLYVPKKTEWPLYGREAESQRLIRGLEALMQHSVAKSFIALVDLQQFPIYACQVPYPIDLSTIKNRLESRFYRRVTALQWDVRMIFTNAELFHGSGTVTAKNANALLEALLKFIEDHSCQDPLPLLNEIVHRDLKTGSGDDDSHGASTGKGNISAHFEAEIAEIVKLWEASRKASGRVEKLPQSKETTFPQPSTSRDTLTTSTLDPSQPSTSGHSLGNKPPNKDDGTPALPSSSALSAQANEHAAGKSSKRGNAKSTRPLSVRTTRERLRKSNIFYTSDGNSDDDDLSDSLHEEERKRVPSGSVGGRVSIKLREDSEENKVSGSVQRASKKHAVFKSDRGEREPGQHKKTHNHSFKKSASESVDSPKHRKAQRKSKPIAHSEEEEDIISAKKSTCALSGSSRPARSQRKYYGEEESDGAEGDTESDEDAEMEEEYHEDYSESEDNDSDYSESGGKNSDYSESEDNDNDYSESEEEDNDDYSESEGESSEEMDEDSEDEIATQILKSELEKSSKHKSQKRSKGRSVDDQENDSDGDSIVPSKRSCLKKSLAPTEIFKKE